MPADDAVGDRLVCVSALPVARALFIGLGMALLAFGLARVHIPPRGETFCPFCVWWGKNERRSNAGLGSGLLSLSGRLVLGVPSCGRSGLVCKLTQPSFEGNSMRAIYCGLGNNLLRSWVQVSAVFGAA